MTVRMYSQDLKRLQSIFLMGTFYLALIIYMYVRIYIIYYVFLLYVCACVRACVRAVKSRRANS